MRNGRNSTKHSSQQDFILRDGLPRPLLTIRQLVQWLQCSPVTSTGCQSLAGCRRFGWAVHGATYVLTKSPVRN
jgi:hypothetical protein